ncbi:hypothetical protein MKQ70_04495 [Chitinophaga sedimenti]|uniref:hypothetical protein n=1 Tax=Chitinophaga sedimenti TaxID=2033606 RepID=UPI0020047320|nr:hypothetical protein [Chitinophaga sedimenti]MCK7554308.1 hypothetical protein [Chitinophaga sedimenti]
MFSQSEMLPDMLPWLLEWKQSGCGFRIISINNEGKELNDYRIKNSDCISVSMRSFPAVMWVCANPIPVYFNWLWVLHR